MTGKNGVDDLRHDRVVISNDAGEYGTTLTQLRHQVVAHFIFHSPGTQPLLAKRTLAQFAERPRQTHDGKTPNGNSFWSDYTPLARSSGRHKFICRQAGNA